MTAPSYDRYITHRDSAATLVNDQTVLVVDGCVFAGENSTVYLDGGTVEVMGENVHVVIVGERPSVVDDTLGNAVIGVAEDAQSTPREFVEALKGEWRYWRQSGTGIVKASRSGIVWASSMYLTLVKLMAASVVVGMFHAVAAVGGLIVVAVVVVSMHALRPVTFMQTGRLYT